MATSIARSLGSVLRFSSRTLSANAAKSAAAEIDAHAMELYRSHQESFYNFPLNKIEFHVATNDLTKKSEPKLVVDGKELNGLAHLSPVAVTRFAFFSETGTLGRQLPVNGALVELTDLSKATLEVTLGADPLACQEKENTVMLEYAEWLRGLGNKLAAHLAANISAYPQVTKQMASLRGLAPDVQLRFLEGTIRSPARILAPKADAAASTVERNPQIVSYKARIYRAIGDKDKSKEVKIRCSSDETMKAQGFQRLHVPLFDSTGKEIPVPDSRVFSGDVITIRSVLRPMVVEIAGNSFQAIKADLRSVVLLRPRERRALGMVSPFTTD
eukprot:m.228172 g.228172  ORF g.228172 m.228172 type:complete len:329 (-) comp17415_c0_seq1:28-1014(-)